MRFRSRRAASSCSRSGRLLRARHRLLDRLRHGQVTFLDPEALFGAGPAQVTARFEQQDLFAVAPTTILGLTSRYSPRPSRGSINLLGVFQREATAYNRPQLGFEAKANLVGGVNTDLHFQSNGDHPLPQPADLRPGHRALPARRQRRDGASPPDPNRSGQAYLEEFEADVGTPLSRSGAGLGVRQRAAAPDGLDRCSGSAAAFDPDGRGGAHLAESGPGTGGGQPFRMRPQDIDTTIVTAGRGDQFETGAVRHVPRRYRGRHGTANDRSSRGRCRARPFRPRWRSMVTPLSTTGVDLSRTEYLEFWVFQSGAQPPTAPGSSW